MRQNCTASPSVGVRRSNMAGVNRSDGRMSHQMRRQMRRPQSDIVEAVLTNEDLVTQLLRGTIGPSTFAATSRVCKLWNSVCRSDETVLRMVVLYQGGVTKTVFCGLFAIVPRDAAALPHTVHRRRNGGSYHLFGKAAVDAVLAGGGMPALCVRLAKRTAVGPRVFGASWRAA